MKQYQYPNGYYPLYAGDMETGLMDSAEEALQDWLDGLDIPLPDEIWENTRRDESAEFNLSALASAADYYGIDLNGIGYPLPHAVNNEEGE